MGIQLRPYRLSSLVLGGCILVACAFPEASAGPANGAAPDLAQAVAQEPARIDAMALCSPSGSAGEPSDWLPAAINAQLSKPENHIDGQDWSGQDLTGKNLTGKVLTHLTLKGTKLRNADLSGAIVCGSDLSGADLGGARLDNALVAGGSKLDGANLTKASARGLMIADASYENLRIDGADLRDAKLVCESDEVRCISQEGDFASMAGADLRGATVAHLWRAVPGLAEARLAGLSTRTRCAFSGKLLRAGAGRRSECNDNAISEQRLFGRPHRIYHGRTGPNSGGRRTNARCFRAPGLRMLQGPKQRRENHLHRSQTRSP